MNIHINKKKEYSTFEGFGASGAIGVKFVVYCINNIVTAKT